MILSIVLPLLLFFTDTPAQYKGGSEAMGKFLMNTTRYPVAAKKAEQQGIVTAEFVVDNQGAITEAVATSAHEVLSAEVLRVVQQMPAWTPASKDGKPVSSKQKLSFGFVLTDKPSSTNKKSTVDVIIASSTLD